ncbi:hypothetical protein HMPREF3227_01672 [Corynebacterium sp. CMW7794]|nr:hypothetical protein HMPREF3227_01672 [Corynebacterium sp. CMW7794]
MMNGLNNYFILCLLFEPTSLWLPAVEVACSVTSRQGDNAGRGQPHHHVERQRSEFETRCR